MHRHSFAGVMSVVAVLMSISPALSQQDWQIQQNSRFGFSLSYPASLFTLNQTSEAGDGHFFNAPSQNARLLVGVIANQDGYTPTSYFNYVASTSYAGYRITYRRIGPSWFAISGVKDGNIFYEKVQFSCNSGRISSFAVVYPAANSSVINPVIEWMENSFRSARNCRASKLSAPAALRPEGHTPG